MRRVQKQMLLDMLQLCSQRQHELRKLSQNQTQEIRDILCLCKSYAEQTREFIDCVQEKGTEIASLLQKYCDLIDRQLSTDGKAYQFKPLQECLSKILYIAKTKLPIDRLEIAFFPYKASMSDSMESIYLAAKADPQCDAYWVPIPYYEKNSEGGLQKFIYEGGGYPDELAAVDWNAYQTNLRHPDIIFIHNPYDNINYVTSVHPDYYSNVLREQTDMLVYVDYGIPYWVKKDPTDVPVFQVHPAIENADLYVCYSKEVAAVHRSNWQRLEQTCGVYTKEQIKKKFVALGSAKFDKVLHTSREKCPLPNEWRERIGECKVLLYNTSLSRLLNESEDFLNEIKRTIHAVSARDDVVLWWRPHPLMMESMKRLRPKLQAEFRSIVMDFQINNRGIFDDTLDLYRAISWSDGCLTHESSLMYLYLATGKPFTIVGKAEEVSDPLPQMEPPFKLPLMIRIKHMQNAKGANIGNWNCCIWWGIFKEMNNRIDHYLDRFLDYIVNVSDYPEAQIYQELQLQMFHDFVANSDGTAGQKIYEYCKKAVLGD